MSGKASVLTKKQCRKTLSGRNSQAKKTIKNVLESPYEKYWPLVNQKNENEIKVYLEKLLGACVRSKVVLNYLDLKKLKKDDRRKKRQELSVNIPTPSKEIMDAVAFGINSVSRHMQRNTAKCVLVSNKVNPRLLTNHISLLSVKNSVPLLAMNTLEDVTTKVLGFKVIAIAFIKQNSSNHFDSLADLILSISQEYPFPKPYIAESLHLESTVTPQPVTSTNNSANIPKTDVVIENVYLKRPSDKTRAFVAAKSKIQNNEVKNWSDFITFDDPEPEEEVKIVKNITSHFLGRHNYKQYKQNKQNKQNQQHKNHKKNKEGKKFVEFVPLKVKRLQGNINRPKKHQSNSKKNKKKLVKSK